jgi:dTDP-glucose 4,6-dehydratase
LTLSNHVLVTGAGGFVGHHVLEHLLVKTDWKISVTDSFRHHGVTDRLREILEAHPGDRVQILTHDLTVPWSSILVEKLLAFGPVDTIFHLASESHVDRSIMEPVPFVQNNVNLQLSILELARLIKPRLFLQLSTDEVYGAVPMGRPAREWDPILPSNPYSASKACQEALSISWWRTYNLPLIIVNCMNIIGERQDPEKFVPKTLARLLNNEPITLHSSKDGKLGSRFYLHARNLASAMFYLTCVVEPVSYGESEFPHRYNVVGEREVDNLTMAQLIAQYAALDLKYTLVDSQTQRPGHDLRYALDGEKLAELGWKAPVSFEDSLRKTVEWSLAHPAWLSLQAKVKTWA